MRQHSRRGTVVYPPHSSNRAKRSPVAAKCGALSAVAAAAVWLIAGAVATAQTSGDASYTAMIEGLCRGYAATQTGIPADLAFRQCMSERYCQGSPGTEYLCQPPGPMTWHGGGY
jgi:hypothetical protein